MTQKQTPKVVMTAGFLGEKGVGGIGNADSDPAVGKCLKPTAPCAKIKSADTAVSKIHTLLKVGKVETAIQYIEQRDAAIAEELVSIIKEVDVKINANGNIK